MAVTYNIKGTTNPSFKIGKKGVVLSPENNTSETTLTLPNATGTAALLESTQTFSGAITFSASGNSLLVDDTLRIAQSGSGLRMTNVGAFDNDGSDNFRIYGTNSLYLRANGQSGGGLSIDSANQNVTIDNNLIVGGDLTIQGTTTTVDSTTIAVTNSFTFEGATADDFETVLTVADPTADRTVTIPDATGQIVLRDTTDTLSNKTLTTPDVDTSLKMVSGAQLQFRDNQSYIAENGGILLWNSAGGRGVRMYSNGNERVAVSYDGNLELKTGVDVIFEGATANDFETTLTVEDPTADRTVTLPDESGTVVVKDSDTGAIQLPVGTTAQRPASPSVGMVRYNTTTSHFEGYDGSAWVHLETQYG